MSYNDVMQNYAPQLAAIAEALKQAAAIGAKASEANTTAKGTISAALKDYAQATHAADVPTDDARNALAGNLYGLVLAGELKAGTLKASGNRFAGFRAMLADEIDPKEWAEATVQDAQDYIASDGVKRRKAIRSAISKVVSEAGKVKTTGDDKRTEAQAEDGLLTIAEAIGADLREYRLMLASRQEGEDDGEEAVNEVRQAVAA